MSDPVYKGRRAPHKQDAHHWHPEDAASVNVLLDHLHFEPGATILDPCAGAGNIVDCCRARGLNITGSDIVDRGHPDDVV
jgi:cyclopropane fatty-acyl-phospholipid synthase-like methyltransferase